MSTAPKLPPSRDQVIEAIETMGRHLDVKIDSVKTELKADVTSVKTELGAKIDKLGEKVDNNAKIAEENQLELNRKLDRLLSKLGV